MAREKSRKDSKGRVLHKGETQRDKYYVYQYKDVNGIRRSVYAKDLPELRDKERSIQKDAYEGIDRYVGTHTTLNMAFEKYISDKVELKQSTYINYKYSYDRYVYPTFGKRQLAKIKYSDVKKFYYSLLLERKLSIGSVEIVHNILHPIFDVAVRDEIIRVNPTNGIIAELKKKNAFNVQKRDALTLQHQQAFMRYIENSPTYAHWLPLFIVLLGTGCRIGEVLGLRWQDVDMEHRNISINHNLNYKMDETGKSFFYISTPKTQQGVRTIPMMEAVYKAFCMAREYQEGIGRKSAVVDGYTDFVFTGRTGNVYKSQTINRVISYIYKAYNKEEVALAEKEGREAVLIPHFSCHTLRHTFCTRLCENETDLKAIQAIMGHSDIATTKNIYDSINEERKRKSILNLENKVTIM